MESAIALLDKVPDGAGALVLAGEGPAFCVGVDLHMTRDAISDGQVEEQLHRLLTAMHTITRKLRALPLPTVAAVEGAAAGAGVADQVAPDGQLWAAAQRLATEVAGASPAALLATRRLMDAAPTHSFDEHLDAEEASIRPLLTTGDVAEGVAAFLERRRPKFQGA